MGLVAGQAISGLHSASGTVLSGSSILETRTAADASVVADTWQRNLVSGNARTDIGPYEQLLDVQAIDVLVDGGADQRSENVVGVQDEYVLVDGCPQVDAAYAEEHCI